MKYHFVISYMCVNYHFVISYMCVNYQFVISYICVNYQNRTSHMIAPHDVAVYDYMSRVGCTIYTNTLRTLVEICIRCIYIIPIANAYSVEPYMTMSRVCMLMRHVCPVRIVHMLDTYNIDIRLRRRASIEHTLHYFGAPPV